MTSTSFASFARRALASLLLLGLVVGAGFALFAWKQGGLALAAAAATQHPEPSETVEGAVARTRSYARSTTSIGTVRALRSITLRNELAGTVRKVGFEPGQIVEVDAVLVELDVAVEQAELAALQAESHLAESMLKRLQEAQQKQGASAADVDRAQAERDKAVAHVARTSALIDRKRVKAPFRARAGMADLHVGQYLEPGTQLTTLQGVDDAVHIDFAVTQDAAALLAIGGEVVVTVNGGDVSAKIVAIDSRVESATRNTWIRALLAGGKPLPQPGASVRVRAGVEAAHERSEERRVGKECCR